MVYIRGGVWGTVWLCVFLLYRHYVAEGVRLYSQETWKLATEMHLVEKYITIVG